MMLSLIVRTPTTIITRENTRNEGMRLPLVDLLGKSYYSKGKDTRSMLVITGSRTNCESRSFQTVVIILMIGRLSEIHLKKRKRQFRCLDDDDVFPAFCSESLRRTRYIPVPVDAAIGSPEYESGTWYRFSRIRMPRGISRITRLDWLDLTNK